MNQLVERILSLFLVKLALLCNEAVKSNSEFNLKQIGIRFAGLRGNNGKNNDIIIF